MTRWFGSSVRSVLSGIVSVKVVVRPRFTSGRHTTRSRAL